MFKKFWASTLMASITTGAALSATGVAQGDSGDSGFVRRGGTSTSAAPAPAADGTTAAVSAATDAAAVAALSATCGRMMVQLCSGYALAAQTGRITDTFSTLLDTFQPEVRRREHHRAHPAGAGRAGHPVPAQPGGCQCQGHRRQRRHRCR